MIILQVILIFLINTFIISALINFIIMPLSCIELIHTKSYLLTHIQCIHHDIDSLVAIKTILVKTSIRNASKLLYSFNIIP